MDEYRPIFFSAMQFAALWGIAMLSQPAMSDNILDLIVLAACSVFTLGCAVKMMKDKRRLAPLPLLGAALVPWLFYLEADLIQRQAAGIDPEIFAQNFTHAVVIYNLLRFFLLITALFVILRDFLQRLKNFHKAD